MTEPIVFGTDGWRGRVGEEFTYENLTRVAQAFAGFLLSQNSDVVFPDEVFIGHDTRHLSSQSANLVSEVIAGNGLRPLWFSDPVPTPLVSWAVANRGAAAGCVITASHNPPDYNGFKIKESAGRSASRVLTSTVETLVDFRPPLNTTVPDNDQEADAILLDAIVSYTNQMRRLVDIDKIRAADHSVVVDPMHGSGGMWTKSLLDGGRLRAIPIRTTPDPFFGGVHPEPIARHLRALSDSVRANRALLGIATDGDADRVGAVDECGNFLSMHQVFPIILEHLVKRRRMSGDVVTTFSQSVVIKRMAAKFGLTLHETPIGFKYIADLMTERDVLIGAEESGGIGFSGHIPERDGILSGLMLSEAVLADGSTPTQIVDRLRKEFGQFHYDRHDLSMPVSAGVDFVSHLKSSPPGSLAGDDVVEVSNLDGTKLMFADDSWILFRQSGTEPVLRVYVEATSASKNADLLESGTVLAKRFSEKAKETTLPAWSASSFD